MSKKQLQVSGITNELEGASSFFPQPVSPSPTPADFGLVPGSQPATEKVTAIDHPENKSASVNASKQASTPDQPIPPKTGPQEINQARLRANQPASKLASVITSKSPIGGGKEVVESIRKVVKQVGKEPLFIRVTPEEKRELTSIVYAFNEMYRDEGRKTSDNEAGRIAVNWMLDDYHQNGQNSILARVLAALNA